MVTIRNIYTYPSHFYSHVKTRVQSIKVNFNRVIEPFTDLLKEKFAKVSYLATKVVSYPYHTMLAAPEVLWRLLFKPDIYPTKPAFIEEINALDDDVIFFQQEIVALNARFQNNHLLRTDLKELIKLEEEILGRYQRLQYYDQYLQEKYEPTDMHDRVSALKNHFEAFCQAIDDYKQDFSKTIFTQVSTCIHHFARRGLLLPEDLTKEIEELWNLLLQVNLPTDNTLKSKYYQLHLAVQTIAGKDFITEQQKIEGSLPLPLHNIGNSCYMDAVLQALLCVPNICQQFRQTILPPVSQDPSEIDKYHHALNIQQEILKFIGTKESGQDSVLSKMDMILLLLEEGPSLINLRQAIFDSQFAPELNGRIDDQYDAGAVMEMFTKKFLPHTEFEFRTHNFTQTFPGLNFQGALQNSNILQLVFKPFKRGVPYTLENILRTSLVNKMQEDDRIFNVQDEKTVVIAGKEQEAEKSLTAPSQPVKEYIQQEYFTKLPNILPIQLKRFDVVFQSYIDANGKRQKRFAGYKKISTPVILPQSEITINGKKMKGVIDFAAFCENSLKNSREETRYKVKSFVVHYGGYGAGHYVSYVEMNGKYFECDDLARENVEITEDEFFGRYGKDAYLIVLEKISPLNSQAQ